MNRTYTINDAIDSVTDYMGSTDDHAPTTIRCALNDALDAADRSGYRVRFDYDQDKAVRAVRKRLGHDERGSGN